MVTNLNLATEDSSDGGLHPENSCFCGVSNFISESNQYVFFEGKKILINATFAEHPTKAPAINCCGDGHLGARTPIAESGDNVIQKGFILIGGSPPVRVGDKFPCGSLVI